MSSSVLILKSNAMNLLIRKVSQLTLLHKIKERLYLTAMNFVQMFVQMVVIYNFNFM